MVDNKETVMDLVNKRKELSDINKAKQEALRVFRDRIISEISSINEDISAIDHKLSKICDHMWSDVNPEDYYRNYICTICGIRD